MSVQHSLNPSVSWHNARLYLGMASVPTHRPVPPGMKQALAPLWNMKSHGQSHAYDKQNGGKPSQTAGCSSGHYSHGQMQMIDAGEIWE